MGTKEGSGITEDASLLHWVSTITDRVIKYRPASAYKLSIWGLSSDLLALICLLRLEHKNLSVIAYNAQQNYESLLRPWLLQKKFSYGELENNPNPFQTIYVQLDAKPGMDLSWFKNVPPGALVVSLWKIDNLNSVSNIKEQLNIRHPLWSEAFWESEFSDSKYVLLAYSQRKNNDL